VTIAAIYTQFDPDIAMHLDEAFERAGISPEAIGQSHIDSAIRSMSYMLNSEWHTLGMRQWMIQYASYTTVTGLNNFQLPVGGIDIFSAVIRRSQRDTPINRMSRTEFLEIPDKVQTGRPDRFMTQRQAQGVTVWLWRTPENNTDQIIYLYFRQMSQPGELMNTLQMPPHVLEAFVSGLSARLALKFNFPKFAPLQELYLPALNAALMEDRDRADVAITYALNPRGGRR
jgi:hypothetical protein